MTITRINFHMIISKEKSLIPIDSTYIIIILLLLLLVLLLLLS